MGLLSRLLGKSNPNRINKLEVSIEKLRVGVFARLYASDITKLGEHEAHQS